MLDTLLSDKLLALFAVVSLGLLLGRVRVAGLSLGSSGVIFVALALGHLGYQIPDGVGLLGMVLFVYCVGLSAGPSFFRVFVRQGKTLAVLGAVLVLVGVVTTWGTATALRLPVDLAAGVFAGAMTSTPALAAAMESLPRDSQVAVGYGIAYPFGVIGIVLFVQLLPRLLRKDLSELSREFESEHNAGRTIARELVEVMNPAVIGKTLSDLDLIAEANCQVSRVLQGDRLVPVSAGFTLELGQHVLLIGMESRLPAIISLLGKRGDESHYSLDTEHERLHVVVSSRNVVGRTIGDLKLLSNFGVTVSRINRHGLEFVPAPSDAVEYGDALNVVGEPDNLARFAAFAGHRARTCDETDLISLGIGILAGVVLGMISFDLGGRQFALGMAGGPLLVALILGHFGRLGRVVGHIPRASQMLMMEIGLVFFLANAGVVAGGTLVPVIREYGALLCAAALAVTFTPMILSYFVARYLLEMNLLQVMGGVCGGMTSTPGLGVITARTDSDAPVISYAAAYPVALILMTVCAQVLVSVLS